MWIQKKKKSKWKAETQSMKMKEKNPEFFIRTVFGLHIWMYLSCLIYIKNKHKSGDFYYFFQIKARNKQKRRHKELIFFLYYCVVFDFDGVTSKTTFFSSTRVTSDSNSSHKKELWLSQKNIFHLNFFLCKRKPQISSPDTHREFQYFQVAIKKTPCAKSNRGQRMEILQEG